jgi:hypothetical protein
MMQLFDNQLLQLVGGLALFGVDTGLRQSAWASCSPVSKQHAQADIFGL